MSTLLETKLKVKELINNNANEKTIDNFIADQGFTIDQIKSLKIDESKGVSLAERFKLGLAPNFKSKEATVKKMYPNSAKMGTNFAIQKNINSPLPTTEVINPKGFDMGDVAEFGGRAAISILPNLLGAKTGFKLGGPSPVGKVLGGMLGAGFGESGAGEASDRIFQAQGGVIDRTPKEYAFNRAFDFGVGGVSELAGPLFLKALKAPFKGFTKTQGNKTLNNLKIFEDANVQPRSMGMLSEAKITGSLLNDMTYILGNIPIAKESISEAGTKMQKEMGDSLMNTANYLVSSPANVSTIKIGNIVKGGIENGVTQFKTKSSSLYDNAFKTIDDVAGNEFLTNPINLVTKLNELGTPSGANILKTVTKKMAKEDPSLIVGNKIKVGQKKSVLQSSDLMQLNKEIQDKIADGRLTFQDLRKYRSMLGKKLTNATLVDDISKAEYKQLYGALSEDLKVILKDKSKSAYTQFLKSDKYYKAGNKRIEDVLVPISKVDQDRIVNYLLTSGGFGPTYISGLKKTLKPEEFGYIQNAVMQKIGRLKSGSGQNLDGGVYSDVFNSNVFLDNWNKIDPQAKDILFSNKLYKGLRADLDRLAVISQKISKSGSTFSDPAGTGTSIIGQLSYAGAVVGGKVSGLSKVFTTGLYLVGGSEVLTNPRIVKWLLKGTDISNTQGVDAYIKHMAKAGTIFAGTSPETQEWVLDFADSLSAENNKKEEKK
tara:strand:+ start:974 stop:3115 length:2142 start_codon:yes stop_codon:yes gene_type:complete